MEIEQLEIHDYLSQCAPLNKLPASELSQLVRSVEISYSRKGEILLEPGKNNYTLFLIRSGSLAVYDQKQQLTGQFSAGDWVGYSSALSDGDIKRKVTAVEDSLLYRFPANVFESLIRQHEGIADYFSHQKPRRLRGAIEDMRRDGETTLIQTAVKNLLHGQPLLVQFDDTIIDVARAMKKSGYTIALIMQDNELQGIVTDRAYCTKVVAGELDQQQAISSIMSTGLITLDKEQTGAEALLLMAQHNIRHIPVMDDKKVIGVVTATDLIRQQSHHSVYLINEINRADNIDELVVLCNQIPFVLQNLIANSMTAYDIGQLISSIGEAVIRRLIALAQKSLGKEPVPFAFVVAGSMARQEQTAVTDQDNAIFLSDDYDENSHGEYFEKLSQFVCDGLNACGYIYCPGDVMAINKKWRQPVNVWNRYYHQWIQEPEPKALMYASIFFDIRCVYGDKSLVDNVQQSMLKKTKDHSIFLKFMIENALTFHPPIGLFRHFVLEDNGHEDKALNMKKRGVVPIIDLTRVYALSAGIAEVNTQQRLLAVGEAGILSREGMSDLKDALEFISSVRLQHQSLQSIRGDDIDNYVKPDILSPLERRHLKDAFDVVRDMQTIMEQRY